MRLNRRVLVATAVALAVLLTFPDSAGAAPLVAANGLPEDWPLRAARLAAQALAGIGGALVVLAATYWLARRRIGR